MHLDIEQTIWSDPSLGRPVTWEKSRELLPFRRHLNPTNSAFFGLLAALSDRGWRLDQDVALANQGVLQRM